MSGSKGSGQGSGVLWGFLGCWFQEGSLFQGQVPVFCGGFQKVWVEGQVPGYLWCVLRCWFAGFPRKVVLT